MSSNWDNLKNQDSPREQEYKNLQNQARAYSARFAQLRIEARKWDVAYNIWNHERQRLYTLLGLKKTNKTYTQVDGVYNTGTYELVKDYGNTYNLREKQDVDTSIMYVLEVDTYKIRDFNKWNDIKTRMDVFLSEAESKFGRDMIPGYFNSKERRQIATRDSIATVAVVGVFFPMLLPAMGIEAAKEHATFKKNNAQWLPLAKAYFEKVEEFEREIRQIASFDYKPRKKPYID